MPKCTVDPDGDAVSPHRQVACRLDLALMAVDDTPATTVNQVLVPEPALTGSEVICRYVKTMFRFPGHVKGYVECDVLGHSSV